MADLEQRIESLEGDVNQLAEILEMFMVGILNGLTGHINTQDTAPHVQALRELQSFLPSLREVGGEG